MIVGASAGLGRALAVKLASEGNALALVATDARDLEALAADLVLRYGVRVSILSTDLMECDPQSLAQWARTTLPTVDAVFLIAGYTHQGGDCGSIGAPVIDKIVGVNMLSGIRLIDAMLDDIKMAKGHIVVAGSVATMRPRRRNAVYGAAKAGLEFYAEAVRHLLAPFGATVAVYRLGYMKTSMTFGQNLPLPVLTPEDAAKHIVSNLGKHNGISYLPRWWWVISAVLNLLPWVVFRRLDI